MRFTALAFRPSFSRSLTRLLPLVVAVILVLQAHAHAYLIRVSVKFILDGNGNRPMGSSATLNTDGEVLMQGITANFALCNSNSPYRVDVAEIVNLRGVSNYFNFGCSVSLEAIAKNNPGAFAWRANMINVYIVNNACGGECSYPSTGATIVLGQSAKTTTLIHEIGHYMNLLHTHGNQCGVELLPACTPPGNDGVADTLPDSQFWNNKDKMALYSYFKVYNLLTSSQKLLVDQSFENLMSYHSVRRIFTPLQNARFHSAAVIYRSGVVDWSHIAGPCNFLPIVAAPDGGGDNVDEDELIFEEWPTDVGLSTIFRHGDVDDDQSAGINDAVTILHHLFLADKPLVCDDAADVNDDGRVDVSDVVMLLGALYQGGSTAREVAPGELIVDLTDDSLGCDILSERYFMP